MGKGGQERTLKRSRTPTSKAIQLQENELLNSAKKQKKLDELKAAEDAELQKAATVLTNLKQSDSTFDEVPTNTFSIRGSFDPKDKLTKILEGIYGREIVRNFMNNDGKRERAARKIVELSSPITQCTKTIGNEGIDTCWLCGGKTAENIVLKPVCEHVLPIAQAVYFLKLYNTQDNYKYAVTEKLEYGWAHSFCNSIKSARIFIIKDPKDSTKYMIDWDSISTFRNNLIFACIEKKKDDVTNANNYQSIINSLNEINPETGTHSMKTTINNKLNPVINFINSRSEDEQKLVLLARVSSFVNPTNLNPEFVSQAMGPAYLGKGKTRRRKQKRRRRHTKRIKMI